MGSFRLKAIATALVCLVSTQSLISQNQTKTPDGAASKAQQLRLTKPDMNKFDKWEEYEKAVRKWENDLLTAVAEHAVVEAPVVGRYQIIVSPSAPKMTFLLDSTTGATWIYCESKDTSSQWCIVPRSGLPAVTEKP